MLMQQSSNGPGIDWLWKTGIVAIARGIPAEAALDVAGALYEGGIRVIEVALNTEGAPDMIRRILDTYKEKLWVGAGTVLDVSLAETAVNAGAQFFVTPNLNERVIDYAVHHRIPVFSGALTATEVVNAFQAGATIVKIFPSRSVGPGYIKELRGPLPHIPLMAVGGISAANAAEFIQAGVQTVGVGGNLVDKRAIQQKDFAKIRQNAAELVRVVQSALTHMNKSTTENASSDG
jgi:2-dehydro-3-deoxyphosphogluconate aldolase / (4S)-4-hydroxy-2-oxoglutarate aldolase